MRKKVNSLFIEKNGDTYTISMTPDLQEDVGTVSFVEFSDDESLDAGDPILNLEASKAVLEISSPISGKVVERNEKAEIEPELLNSTKVEENWLVRLTEVDETVFTELEDAE